MKLGELFIQLGVQGDTKKLDEAISKLDKAQSKEKMQAQFRDKILKINEQIAKATTREQRERLKGVKTQLRDNYVNQIKLDRLKDQRKILNEQQSQWQGMIKGVLGFVAGVTSAVVVMDRLGNSALRANQLYTNFTRQTGMSMTNLNQMAGVAKLSGMNLPVEQVASDLNNLQQKIFRLGLTGEGSAIFAQLGMNPMGMNSDQFIKALRNRFRGLSGVQKSYALDELGLSREWLTVLELSDDAYADIVEQSKKLQLTEKERKQLAKYTFMQQQNNMRWELAKQKIILAVLPLITKIMDLASKIALAFGESFNDKKLAVVRDLVALLALASMHALNIKNRMLGAFGLGALGAGVGAGAGAKGLAGKAGVGIVAKSLGKRALGFLGSPLGIGVLAWTVYDIYKLLTGWYQKDTEQDENEPPVDWTSGYNYQNVKSNMVNHFYNNPMPQQEVINELTSIEMRYLKEAKK